MQTNDLEIKIISTAREMFIRKGYVETNMSDIAAALGINRPTLHYYFRTKEKMFDAVFGDILKAFVDKIRIILHTDTPILERLSRIIDAYFVQFTDNPDLPLFLLREIQRDSKGLVRAVFAGNVEQLLKDVRNEYRNAIAKGEIADVPFSTFAMTFYGLISFPFLSRSVLHEMVVFHEANQEDFLASWKTHILSQISYLLTKQ